MMSGIMIYGVVLAAFLGGATHFLDRGLRALGRPTRWVWALGMAAAVGFVFASTAWGTDQGAAGPAGAVPVDALYDLLAGGSHVGPAAPGLPGAMDGPLTLLWLLGSLSLLTAALWAGRRLYMAKRRWEKRRLGAWEVLVSDGLGPAVLGLIRPVIVVPPWVLEIGPEEQEMILLHEGEHQGAKDPALLVLALALVAAMPWNPVLWWMGRRLHLAVEGDCDARVLARGVSAKRYGSLLLEIASGGRSLSALTPALAEGGETFLERRLLMIRSAVRKRGFLAAVLPLVLSGGFLVLACETPTPPASLEATLRVEASTTPSMETSVVPVEVSEGDDGYFLVKKDAGKVKYVGSVSEDQLQLIQEGEPGVAFRVGQITLPDESPTSKVESSVKIKQFDAQEGTTVRIRQAGGEDAGPKPLVVVDGVISSDPNILESLDKANIASIEIVKGAAATQLYGARAAGGVVKVTTKK